MAVGIPCFDAVCVVSDLHLGGEPERAIFQDDARLGRWITGLCAEPPERSLALVLNGDIVDFLAEPGAKAFDPAGAPETLRRIAGRFPAVFEGLRRFTATPGRTLVLVLGNHDIELRLPQVTETLLGLVCAEPPHRGRVRLCLDGAGFRCSVGGRSVFVVHGNDADPWNVVDHEGLRAVAAAQGSGKGSPSVKVNAGTTLVIEVLNEVKRTRPWIDLLKPEDLELVRLLWFIEPRTVAHAVELPQIAARFGRDYLSRLLGDDGATGDGTSGRAGLDEGAAIADAIRRIDAGERPTAHVGEDETLGYGRAILERLFGRSGAGSVREAMATWQKRAESGFKIDATSSDDARILATVDDEVDIVVAGHTHVARSQPRATTRRTRDGRPWYFNSGSWIVRFKRDPSHFASDEAFRPMWEALTGSDKTPRALLAAPTPPLEHGATAVRVAREGGRVRGALLRFPGDGAETAQVAESECSFEAREEG